MYMKGRRRRVFTVQSLRKVLDTEAERGGKMACCTNFIDILSVPCRFLPRQPGTLLTVALPKGGR